MSPPLSHPGVTKKIDEKLKISEKLSLAAAKVDDVKSSVNDKLTDLKAKAAAAE